MLKIRQTCFLRGEQNGASLKKETSPINFWKILDKRTTHEDM